MDSCPSVFSVAVSHDICEKKEDGNFYGGSGLGKMLVDWIVNKDDRLKGQYGMLLTSDAQGLYSKYGFTEYEKSCVCRF